MHDDLSHALAEPFDVAVVGGGPAGLTAAVALARAGVSTALIAPPHCGDNRTTALLAGSVAVLERLEVWERCREDAEALCAIRIIDDRGGLVRAPEVLFDAAEIGLDAFGYNIPTERLVAALAARAATLPTLRIVPRPAAAVVTGDDRVAIRLSEGETLTARLVVGADGRASLCRQAAGIATRTWHYPQSALTCNVTHSRPHRGVSTEFHTAAGPFTLVPLPGNRSGLVWVARSRTAERLRELDETRLSAAIERQAHSFLGTMKVEGARGLFPLSGMSAERFADRRIALVGEAAHVIPPIGAQGFNLGLRDAVTIADLAAQATRSGGDPGASALLARYAAERGADAGLRSAAVDLLNRSLLADFLPLQAARGLGLALLGSVGPLRRALMRQGVGPSP